MKVLHIVGKSSGGIRQHVNSLNHELKLHGIKSSIIAPVGTMDGLCEADATYITPRLSKPLSIIKCAKAVSYLIEKNDVLHVHGLIASIVALKARNIKKSQIPIVMTLHNLAEKKLEGKKYFFKHKIEQKYLSQVDYIICPSEYAQNHARVSTKNKVKIKTVLPIGKQVSTKEMVEAKKHRLLTRDKFYVDHHTPLCISLSRYSKQKDIPTLIKSFDLVIKKIPKAQLIIAGHGSFKNTVKYQKLIQHLDLEGNVHLYRNIDDPEKLLAASDLFVLSSIYETVPLVLIEALEFGLPVVMTEVGIADQILNGVTGTCVSIKNPEKLSNAIITWLTKVSENSVDHKELTKSVEDLMDQRYTVDPIIGIYKALTNS